MSTQSQVISKVLSPAVRLWLRSQVEQIEELQFQITGGDRQILSGHIPKVTIFARGAVYQGLHLSQVQLTGEGIRVNLGQVLRGQPLRLLEPVPVEGELYLSETDLNASLQAPLLANAVTDFLLSLLKSDLADTVAGETLELQDPQVTLTENQLTLRVQLASPSGTPNLVTIRTGLQLASGHELQFIGPQWLPSPTAKRGMPLADLDGYILDLGPEVAFQELLLEPGRLICRGTIRIIP